MRHERIVDCVVETQQIVQMLMLRSLVVAAHLGRDVFNLQHVIRCRDVREQGCDNQGNADEAQKPGMEGTNALIAIVDPRHQYQGGQSKTGPNQVERGVEMHFILRLSCRK